MWSSCIPVVATLKGAAFTAELNLTFFWGVGGIFLSASNSKLHFTAVVKKVYVWTGLYDKVIHWLFPLFFFFFNFLIVLSAFIPLTLSMDLERLGQTFVFSVPVRISHNGLFLWNIKHFGGKQIANILVLETFYLFLPVLTDTMLL